MTASFDRSELTHALTAEVRTLVDDLRTRADEVPEVTELFQREWQQAVDAERTAFDLETWREGELEQVAVSWVLGCVFVRFCEDNGLIPDPLLSGRGERRRWANDAKVAYFRDHSDAGERAWLRHVFETAAGFHGLAEAFGSHNPLWRFDPSDDACRNLLAFWQRTDADSEGGELLWDFTDSTWDTRFLGDLYQDLSEHAKKQYALLQTPDFVEAFILDRTLDPALAEFGLNGHDGEGFRLIDPACGSGHFLLGAFDRLARGCLDKAPADGPRAAAARALGMVYGVDLNPFAVSIARFRLLVASLRFADVKTLAEAPNFTIQVAAGDSLLWGASHGRLEGVIESAEAQAPLTRHLYATEDGDLLRRYFGQHYHAVVANPPYITPKDPAANAAYRDRYETCHRQYSLAVPFMERLFSLAQRGADGRPAGFVGQITANSFMKREFGKKLIEKYLASDVDLTHVIDTSGAYIPGHGTPTVILAGRNRHPVGGQLRAVLGIRGEPSTPDEPAKGLVWSSIVDLWDQPGAENEYVSSVDLDREGLAHHPWSLQGGAAAPLREIVEKSRCDRLERRIALIGFGAVTREDEVFRIGKAADRARVGPEYVRPLVAGEELRDWHQAEFVEAIWPYDVSTLNGVQVEQSECFLWPWKAQLSGRVAYGKSQIERGLNWSEYSMFFADRYRTPLSIAFAFVATHNHFVLDRGGKVFNRSAPVIKLDSGAEEDGHLQLLGLLNSATACFWMKQVFHDKGNRGTGGGITSAGWERFHEFDGTKLKQFPLVEGSVLAWSARLDELAQQLGQWFPSSLAETQVPSSDGWADSQRRVSELRAEMVWLQEELDWRCAHLYGVTDTDLSLPPDKAFGLDRAHRSFAIALARKDMLADSDLEWFSRHELTPTIELPGHWPEEYRQVVERRLELIESDRFVNLLERPEYKRRWNWDAWDELAEQALVEWLAARLEDPRYWSAPEPRSVAQLADVARADADFMQVAELYRGRSEIDYVELIGELLEADAVPYLAAWRYKDPGLRKRASWEKTWDLQRREDAGEHVGKIPVPPKYKSSDFRSTTIWKARGKLDVPKERFVSYPGLERSTDTTGVYGWAGWDHLDQAKAVTALYNHRLQQEGWDAERVTPILAGLAELIPWLKQWHNEIDPSIGQGLGDYFDDYLQGEVRRHQLTPADLRTWRPPAKTRRRRSRRRSESSSS